MAGGSAGLAAAGGNGREELTKRPKDLGQVKRSAWDNGYDSQDHVEAWVSHGIDPFIAVGRQSHDEALEAGGKPGVPYTRPLKPLAGDRSRDALLESKVRLAEIERLVREAL